MLKLKGKMSTIMNRSKKTSPRPVLCRKVEGLRPDSIEMGYLNLVHVCECNGIWSFLKDDDSCVACVAFYIVCPRRRACADEMQGKRQRSPCLAPLAGKMVSNMLISSR